MSATSCAIISDQEITRDIIGYLNNLSDTSKATVRVIIEHVSQTLSCNPGDSKSEEYARWRRLVKEVWKHFSKRIQEPDKWAEFQAKFTSVKIAHKRPDLNSPLSSAVWGVDLSREKLIRLNERCQNVTLKQIKELASDLGITRAAGKALSKVSKGDFCEAIEKALKQADVKTSDDSSAADFSAANATIPKKIVPSGELESLSLEQISRLDELCRTTTLPEIKAAAGKMGLERVAGKTLAKITKGDLCKAISKLVSSPSKLPDTTTQVPRPGSPKINMTKCHTRANTVEQLRSYIAAQGWDLPGAKWTKSKICSYIEQMEAKQAAPGITAPLSSTSHAMPSKQSPRTSSDTMDVPLGYDDCSNPRGSLTKPKIRAWIMDKGWHLEPDFPGFPGDKKDKATWCAFLAQQITTHPLVAPTEPEKVSTRAVSCAQNGDWKRPEDVESDLANCPPGTVCAVDSRVCVEDAEAESRGLVSFPFTLKNGKKVSIYAKNSETLNRLKPSLHSFITSPAESVEYEEKEETPSRKSCGTLASGTPNELLEDLSCPPNQICNLESKSCGPSEKLAPGMIKLTFRGKEIVGPVARINELKQAVEKQAPRVEPTIPKTKPKISFRPGKVIYGEEEKKRQAEASAMLSKLIGEPIVPKTQEPISESEPEVASEPVIISPPKPEPVVVSQVIAEEPSIVSRMVARLKDIRTQPNVPPVRLVRAEAQLNKSISACVGIQS